MIDENGDRFRLEMTGYLIKTAINAVTGDNGVVRREIEQVRMEELRFKERMKMSREAVEATDIDFFPFFFKEVPKGHVCAYRIRIWPGMSEKKYPRSIFGHVTESFPFFGEVAHNDQVETRLMVYPLGRSISEGRKDESRRGIMRLLFLV